MIFFTENPNLNNGKNIFFCFLCWGGRKGEVVSDFFKQRLKNLDILVGGWNGMGSVARG